MVIAPLLLSKKISKKYFPSKSVGSKPNVFAKELLAATMVYNLQAFIMTEVPAS